MRNYLTRYRAYISQLLNDENTDFTKLLEYHRKHIEFFMHERLIHLIVTVLFAALTVACIITIVCTGKIILAPLALLLLVLLIPYIRHYYFLENQTQELYKDYEKICRKTDGFSIDNTNRID